MAGQPSCLHLQTVITSDLQFEMVTYVVLSIGWLKYYQHVYLVVLGRKQMNISVISKQISGQILLPASLHIFSYH